MMARFFSSVIVIGEFFIGKANFGFVSKYEKGKNVPSGQTECRWPIFNFHSTSYDWLVIAGPKARYKGNGIVNGTGNYGFMLTAVDGSINGGGGTDMFRMRSGYRNRATAIRSVLRRFRVRKQNMLWPWKWPAKSGTTPR